MSIVFNGVNIENLIFNDVEITEAYFNDVLVFKKSQGPSEGWSGRIDAGDLHFYPNPNNAMELIFDKDDITHCPTTYGIRYNVETQKFESDLNNIRVLQGRIQAGGNNKLGYYMVKDPDTNNSLGFTEAYAADDSYCDAIVCCQPTDWMIYNPSTLNFEGSSYAEGDNHDIYEFRSTADGGFKFYIEGEEQSGTLYLR